MHAWRGLAPVITALLLAPAAWGAIDRWADSQGVAAHSDTVRPGARRVEAAFTPGFAPAPAPSLAQAGSAAPAQNYTGFGLVRPAAGATIHSNLDQVEVELKVEPALKPGDRIRVILDGSPLPEMQTTTRFTLNRVYRGSHTLQAAIVDSQGNTLTATDTVTFYLWHASRLFRRS